VNAPTSPDNRVWFELYAVEVEIGQAQLIQLPEPQPDCLGPFELADSHPHQRNNQRGAPVKTVIAVFTRPIVAGVPAAIRAQPPAPVQRAATPAPQGQRKQQEPTAPPAQRVAMPRPGNAVPSVVDGLQALAANIAGGVARHVVPIAERLADAAGIPPAPVAPAAPASNGAAGELSCSCAEPLPAIDNGAPAVPCANCGGWIQMAPPPDVAAPEAPTAQA
jgi:hypothetical protein